MKIAPRIHTAARLAIDSLMQEVKGAKAVVVSTEDGFEVAGRVENTAKVAQLSAVASSLAALGALASEESGLGACTSVTVETEAGHVVMVQVRHREVDLIVSIVAGPDAIIGQILYFARQAAKTLAQA
jgi:predicted regulator of Ras-like GTPase activity (Roadblock/LC7/MglB family)